MIALQAAIFLAPTIVRHLGYLNRPNRIRADWPCETSASTYRNLATTSSGLWRFLGILVLLSA
jgi:hypothetical protein